MDRIFIPIYRFFRHRQGLLWTLVAVTFAIFVVLGLRTHFEEDITKLLSQTESSADNSLIFGNLQIKDKIFLQFVAPDSLDTYEKGILVDEFMDSLLVADSSSHYVRNALYRIDADLAVMGIDYAMRHVPSFVDTSCYSGFDKALSLPAAQEQMAENYNIMMEDMTGSATTMVSTDPFALRNFLAASLLPQGTDGISAGSLSGFSLVDNHLFSKDSTIALAFLSPNFTSFDSKSGTRLVDMIESEAGEFSASHPGVEVLFHGAPVRSVFNSRRIKADLVLTIGLSFALILMLLCVAFRSLAVIPLLAMPVAYGAFFALACMYLLQGGMSLMALGIGAIVLGVAVSYCLHVITHHVYVGDSEKMLRDESTPVCLGCLTTIGAFMGLLLTSSSLLRDFGLFATLALVGNTLFALIVLPHVMDRTRQVRRNEKVFFLISRMDEYPIDRKAGVLIPVAVAIAVCLFFAGKVGFDSDLRNIGYNDPNVVRSQELYSEKNFGGNTQVYFAAVDSTLDGALSVNEKILSRLDSLKEAGLVATFSPAVRILFPSSEVQEERIAAWNAYWTPEKVGEAMETLSQAVAVVGLDVSTFDPFRSMVTSDYEPGSLYDEGILPDGLISNFIEQSPDGKFLVFTPVQIPSDKSAKTVEDAVAAIPHATVVDPFYYMSDMVEVIHSDFSVVLAISSLFVFLILLISFRNILVALVAFLPMFLSWYVVEGVMALSGLEFNLINIVISTFIFGIGVDYSIFVMEGLLSQAKGEGDDLLAYHKTAIFFSAFVLLIVVLSLMFASHPAIRSIGVSTFIGMASTILITYTLQPFLFRWLLRRPAFRRSVTRRK